MDEQVNGWTGELMNRWTDELLNSRANQQVNEWTIEASQHRIEVRRNNASVDRRLKHCADFFCNRDQREFQLLL